MSNIFLPIVAFCVTILNMGKKLERISIRIDEDLNNQFGDVANSLKVSRPELLRLLMQSICNAYKKHGKITIPIEIKAPTTSIIGQIEESESIYGVKEKDPDSFFPNDITMEDFSLTMSEITESIKQLAINKARFKKLKEQANKDKEI